MLEMADQAHDADTEGVEYDVAKDPHLPTFAEDEYPLLE